jgi:hypothetical protein
LLIEKRYVKRASVLRQSTKLIDEKNRKLQRQHARIVADNLTKKDIVKTVVVFKPLG